MGKGEHRVRAEGKNNEVIQRASRNSRSLWLTPLKLISPLVRIECMPCRVSTEVKKDERDSCGVVDMIENAWHPWRRRFPRSQCTSSLYCRIELAFLVQTQVRLEPPSEGGSVPRSKVGADLAVLVPWLVGTEGWRSYWPRSSAKDIKETHANEVLTVSWARVWTAWPARPPGEFCPWNPLRGCRSSAALSTAPPFLPSWRTSGLQPQNNRMTS